MNKPQKGDILKVVDPEVSLGYSSDTMSDAVRVVAVFDSLDESWDPWGESAWAQRDHDESTGQTGEWYIIAEEVKMLPDGTTVTAHEGETWSLASYEIASH